uniref:Transmembrane protein n=1 Tax=Chromera velia CCMP2878 TaxID=1169474 RepID=A0A0G4H249_9ALVE|mmetsp:Transcript_52471/g.102676  ORF Transcript_52471/g.102676 Transcript_52471/m.102676 type:complete len:204 (-) Transcript_52471:280-891(-)|eukprot:Cvel_5586.t1-p1 / transcript=Cvel_5586.t1 / gene=Cvel_5586 / organism=Chromera_velia_CCMP2878 / gene_product=hypothetical protein / transcript_product=hypothetical protein / location=Cvel_scaffold262:99835-100443(-) / protein_length=203 / sequence_SO=supercontig / SO=protein_coding / is_pseudo=false
MLRRFAALRLGPGSSITRVCPPVIPQRGQTFFRRDGASRLLPSRHSCGRVFSTNQSRETVLSKDTAEATAKENKSTASEGPDPQTASSAASSSPSTSEPGASKEKPKRTPEQLEADAAAKNAEEAERMWRMFAPDRYMSVFSPGFVILLVLVIGLHAYNDYMDRQKDSDDVAEAKEESLRKEAEEKRKQRIAAREQQTAVKRE